MNNWTTDNLMVISYNVIYSMCACVLAKDG